MLRGPFNSRERTRLARSVPAWLICLCALGGFAFQTVLAWYAALNPRQVLPALPSFLVFPDETDFRAETRGQFVFPIYSDDAPLRNTLLITLVDMQTEESAERYAEALSGLGESQVDDGRRNTRLPATFDLMDLAQDGEPRLAPARDLRLVSGGWPMRSWFAYEYEAGDDGTRTPFGAVVDPAVIPSSWSHGSKPSISPIGYPPLIPGKILLLGSIVNSAVYGFTPLGLVYGWLAVRRVSRVRRGCCTSCGYSLKDIEGQCPECGTPVVDRKRRKADV
ncbi:MAG: hypothetical protein AAFQ17_05180 [Pseudomonadota bacterium]